MNIVNLFEDNQNNKMPLKTLLKLNNNMLLFVLYMENGVGGRSGNRVLNHAERVFRKDIGPVQTQHPRYMGIIVLEMLSNMVYAVALIAGTFQRQVRKNHWRLARQCIKEFHE